MYYINNIKIIHCQYFINITKIYCFEEIMKKPGKMYIRSIMLTFIKNNGFITFYEFKEFLQGFH